MLDTEPLRPPFASLNISLIRLYPAARTGQTLTRNVAVKNDLSWGNGKTRDRLQKLLTRQGQSSSLQKIERGITCFWWHFVPEDLLDFRNGVFCHRKVTVWFLSQAVAVVRLAWRRVVSGVVSREVLVVGERETIPYNATLLQPECYWIKMGSHESHFNVCNHSGL